MIKRVKEDRITSRYYWEDGERVLKQVRFSYDWDWCEELQEIVCVRDDVGYRII